MKHNSAVSETCLALIASLTCRLHVMSAEALWPFNLLTLSYVFVKFTVGIVCLWPRVPRQVRGCLGVSCCSIFPGQLLQVTPADEEVLRSFTYSCSLESGSILTTWTCQSIKRGLRWPRLCGGEKMEQHGEQRGRGRVRARGRRGSESIWPWTQSWPNSPPKFEPLHFTLILLISAITWGFGKRGNLCVKRWSLFFLFNEIVVFGFLNYVVFYTLKNLLYRIILKCLDKL